ncbi:MAG TPA: septal ring lytic transglycosylase RlpA family protein [Gallionella sp.]|nr:septal ring lytic transglycosylase RlpA family protein [Gallionella sp.]
MQKQSALLMLATLALAACTSAPQRTPDAPRKSVPIVERGTASPAPGSGGYLVGDGPGADIPANLDETPDAVPRSEPLHRYANRPYIALGKNYTPLTEPGNYKERGIASWYGKKFHGQRTSSGEVYDMYGMTAAHPTLPIPSYARVTNLANKKSVVVRVNDRGPFLHDRIMDLSYVAAHKLGLVGNGSTEVEVESIAAVDSAVVTPIAAVEPVKSEPLPPAPAPVVANPAPAPAPAAVAEAAVPTAPAAAGGNTYLQLGAFRSQQGAESFLARMRADLGYVGKEVSLFLKDGLMRVHLGPFANADEAKAMAEKLEAKLGFKPVMSLH